MDIFKFNNPASPTKMEQGEVINGFKSKMWIERYRNPGEFTLVANASSGLRDKLPIGSFISHIDTKEIMMVENHEISDNRETEAELIITGRGFESFLENRIVGSNKTFPTNTGNYEYIIASNPVWDQANTLLRDHLTTANLLDDNDAVPYLLIMEEANAQTSTTPNAERKFKRDNLLKALLDILDVEDLGIKVVRPGPWSPYGASDPNTLLRVHRGVDRTKEIIFSYDTGEIESADYLWSIKKLKNTAMVTGKWVETLVTTTETQINRRMMLVDAKDLDDHLTAAPTGVDLDAIVAAMQTRGKEALAAQKQVELAKAEVSREVVKAGYRKDFDVGDLITVLGDYSLNTTRRISEYVEIEDENGTKAYPTLSTV